jgi:heme-degrading monooxygenase HmoA
MGPEGTIVRLWRGQSKPQGADAYHRHVTGTVFPALARIPGYRGGYVLRREIPGRVEFLVATLWDSMDAVRSFAGPDPERAVVEPAARAALAEYDERVQHYHIVHVHASA